MEVVEGKAAVCLRYDGYSFKVAAAGLQCQRHTAKRSLAVCLFPGTVVILKGLTIDCAKDQSASKRGMVFIPCCKVEPIGSAYVVTGNGIAALYHLRHDAVFRQLIAEIILSGHDCIKGEGSVLINGGGELLAFFAHQTDNRAYKACLACVH